MIISFLRQKIFTFIYFSEILVVSSRQIVQEKLFSTSVVFLLFFFFSSENFFFFLLKKLGEKISMGNDRFRARFNFQFSIFDSSSKVRFEFFASLFFSLILRKLKFYETMYTRDGQGTGLSVRRFLVELPLKVTISSVEKTLGERIERTLLL